MKGIVGVGGKVVLVAKEAFYFASVVSIKVLCLCLLVSKFSYHHYGAWWEWIINKGCLHFLLKFSCLGLSH